MAKIGSLILTLAAKTDRFKADLQSASLSVSKAEKAMVGGFSRVAREIFSLKGALVTLTGAGGFGLLVKSSLDTVDALAKTSDSIGIATEDLAALRYAAERTGVGSDKLDRSLQRMVRNLSEAAQGTGEAKGAIDELGLSASALAAAGPDAAFRAIADAMQGVETQADRARIAYELFGREGINLTNTLALGSEGLDQMAQRAEMLGLAVSRVDAAKIEAANDAMDDAGDAARGAANIVAANLAPWIKVAAERFAEASAANDGFSSSIVTGMEWAAKSVGFVADTFRGLKVVFLGIRSVFADVMSFVLSGLQKLNEGGAAIINLFSGITGITIDPSQGPLAEMADLAAYVADDIRQEFVDALNEPMPSEGIEAWFAKVKADAEKAGQEIAAKAAERQGIGGASLGLVSKDAGLGGATEAETDNMRESLARQIEQLDLALMSQEERLFQSYANRQLMIEDAADQQIISEARKYELLRSLDEKYESDLTRLRISKAQERERATRQIEESRKAAFGSLFSSLNTLASSGSKRLFEITKKLNIAQAITDAYGAFNKALNNPPGPPYTIPMAAAALAQGLVQVNRIRATSFGGGGGGGGGGGSLPSPATPADEGAATDGGPVVVTEAGAQTGGGGNTYIWQIYGDTVSTDHVIEVMGEMNRLVGNGHELIATRLA